MMKNYMNNMKMGNCTHNILQFKVIKKNCLFLLPSVEKRLGNTDAQ